MSRVLSSFKQGAKGLWREPWNRKNLNYEDLFWIANAKNIHTHSFQPYAFYRVKSTQLKHSPSLSKVIEVNLAGTTRRT